MIADVQIRRDPELDNASVEGLTDEGVSFVDAVIVPTLQVVDSGQIIVAARDVPSVIEAAEEIRLTIDDELAARFRR